MTRHTSLGARAICTWTSFSSNWNRLWGRNGSRIESNPEGIPLEEAVWEGWSVAMQCTKGLISFPMPFAWAAVFGGIARTSTTKFSPVTITMEPGYIWTVETQGTVRTGRTRLWPWRLTCRKSGTKVQEKSLTYFTTWTRVDNTINIIGVEGSTSPWLHCSVLPPKFDSLCNNWILFAFKTFLRMNIKEKIQIFCRRLIKENGCIDYKRN